MVIWPTVTPLGDATASVPAHRPEPTQHGLFARAQELDATLRDAASDLGFTLDVADDTPPNARELDLLERAQNGGVRSEGTWVVTARIERAGLGDSYLLRVMAAPPHARTLRVRVERVSGSDVSARGLVMLREVLLTTKKVTELDRDVRPSDTVASPETPGSRSPGRAVLAVSGAVFGGFVGFSLQKASGSDDPRLLYPLVTIGTGAGLGSALLAAGEWSFSTGDAWTVAGGMGWGTTSGLFLATGTGTQPFTDRYLWGVGGGLIGTAGAVALLSRRHATEGDAMLTNSGGGVGLLGGVLIDVMARGTLDARPSLGIGIGSAAGVTLAGASTLFVHPTPNRVLLVDLGIGAGGLLGSAAASPLIFENVTSSKSRGFAAATLGGMVTGGLVAYLLTRDTPTTGAADDFASRTRVGTLSAVPAALHPCAECTQREGSAFGFSLDHRF